MNENYLEKYLDILILTDKTIVKFWKKDKLSFVYEYSIGIKNVEDDLVSEIILSDWINGIIYSLQQISLLDRVPTFIYLTTEKYGGVFEKKIKHPLTYSQFYIEDTNISKGVHVIIKKINYTNINSLVGDFDSSHDLKLQDKNKSKSYERYTKTISQFKI